ncbi:hypothetical protein EVAR_27498_1 [Eumeta japonica]|uniref:Uncharacterized protein n=1 Tax=Eumeta variegata TaxID=151549 RepID=A0A4C1XCJ2_EUMVA|nr:hypothetical protein EVAR_27498_1 [Eumeta japonica]
MKVRPELLQYTTLNRGALNLFILVKMIVTDRRPVLREDAAPLRRGARAANETAIKRTLANSPGCAISERVDVNDMRSSGSMVSMGVPQGLILGPFLLLV